MPCPTVLPTAVSPSTRSADLVLARSTEAAALARRTVAALVPHDADLADRGGLLITEAVANAVEHTEGEQLRVTLNVDPRCGTLFCAVFDTDPTIPRPAVDRDAVGQDPNADIDALAESGRGLHLIDRLSQAWGFRPSEGGKWAWFRLSPAGNPS